MKRIDDEALRINLKIARARVRNLERDADDSLLERRLAAQDEIIAAAVAKKEAMVAANATAKQQLPEVREALKALQVKAAAPTIDEIKRLAAQIGGA